MRAPQHAGTFYEKGERSLQDQIKACFEDERGPGETPTIQKKAQQPLAVIAPHAGYAYSGPCAAWSYKALGDAPMADLYIILAPSHQGGNGITIEPFQTPLGIVRVDQDFARRLVEKGTIKVNQQAHATEHSIEVQLPFLQYSFGSQAEKIKILPILVDHELDLHQLAIDLKETVVETGRKVVYIVSTDFTHYGRAYHYVPFSKDVQQNIAELDKGAIELIKQGDHEGLLRYADEKMVTICGTLPIALLLRIIRPTKVLVEQYYTSAVVTKDEKNSVSYASIVFY